MEKPYIQHTLENKKETNLERHGNITTILTDKATYVVVFGNHTIPTEINSIPENAEALFLEGVGDWTQYTDEYENLKAVTQYSHLMQKLKEKNIPIYFGDVFIENAIFIDNLIVGGETALGATLISHASLKKEELESAHMSRRTFFKKAAGVVAASYLISPVLSTVASDLSFDAKKRHETFFDNTKKEVDKIHLELRVVLLSFRNAVLSFKEQYVASLGNKRSLIATIIGAQHTGMEEDLQSSQEEKLQYLKKFKPFLRKLVVVPETFYTIRINHPDGGAETLVVEDLKKLWNDSQ